MPSTYSPNLRIQLIATGEQSGTWGTTTNTNLGTLIEDAIAGYVAVTVTTADQALTALNGAADQSRNMTIALSTTTSDEFNVYIPPAEKFYVIRNLSAYDAVIFCSTVLGNTTAAGTGVRIAAGTTFQVCSDGTNVYEAVNSFAGSLTVTGDLTVNGNATLGSPRLSATYSQTGTTLVTVTTSTAHEYTTGDVIQFIPTSGDSNGGSYTITVTGTTSFTFTNTSRTTSGNAFVTNDTTTLNGVLEPGVVISSDTGTTYPALRITQVGTGNALLVEDSTNPDSTPFVVDADGQVLVGSQTAITYASGVIPQLQVNKLGSEQVGISRFTNDTGGNALIFLKSRGTAFSNFDVVSSGDSLGTLAWYGADGTAGIQSATINATVDGTPTIIGGGPAIDMPGRLVFSTTAVGATSPTERLRIDSAGRVDMRSNMGSGATGTSSSISGTTLTVGGTVTGTFAVGDRLIGANVEPNTFITALGTGTGGAGTYTVSNSQTAAAAAISAIVGGVNVFRFTDTDASVGQVRQPMGVIEWYGSDISTPGAGVKAYIAGISETGTPDAALIFGTSDNVADTQAVERMRIDSAGQVGIGGATSAGITLWNRKNITGNTNSYGYALTATVQSDVTASATGYFTNISSAASSFVLPNLRHYSANQSTVGLGSTITTQYGFVAEASLTGATNNYGFYSNIAAATDRWNFYAAGTADNVFVGNVGIGQATTPIAPLHIGLAEPGGEAIRLSFNSGTTTQAEASIGFGRSLTAVYPNAAISGQEIDASDFRGNLLFYTRATDTDVAPTERMRLRSDGGLGLGGPGSVSVSFYNQANITGNTTAYGNYTVSTVQSDVTSVAYGNRTALTTAAASFTLGTLNHYAATQTTLGAGSTVTNQYGFHAENGLTGATNNYGFFSNIAAGTGDWNFYANGTATNYFAGDVGIGTNSVEAKLTVLSGTQFDPLLARTTTNLLARGAGTAGLGTYGGAVTFSQPASSRPWGAITGVQTTADTDQGGLAFFVHGSATTNDQLQEAMRLGANGNIGIGVENNSANRVLINSDFIGTSDGRGVGTNLGSTSGAPLTTLYHFIAQEATFGDTVSTQAGFLAASSLTGATNNYGFQSNIAAGTGRWNFYANGTAPNYFEGDVRTDAAFLQVIGVVNGNASTTLSASSVMGGSIRTGTPTAGITYTLPTGTACDAVYDSLQTSMAVEWSVVNLAAATHSITVAANTGHTVVGNMVVAANSSGRFQTRKTGTNTFVSYRIG
jgi:hypothetical protein